MNRHPHRGRKAGKVNGLVTAKRKAVEGKEELDEEIASQRTIFPDPDTLPEHPAYVGVSVSVGTKTKWASESIDAAAWCTLPSGTHADEIQETYATAREIALEECNNSLNAAIKKFFPEMGEKE